MAFSPIVKPNQHFNTVLYTGNGANYRSITGVGFQPDLVWNKGRDNSWQNIITDSVRGATKNFYSDGTNGDVTDSSRLQSFNSDGFTIGTNNQINNNGNTYVAWCWKFGTTSGLSGGTITPSSYSINAAAGMGIYKYSGTGSAGTIAHGLGKQVSSIWVKRTDTSSNWQVYHRDGFGYGGATRFTKLNQTSTPATSSTRWNDTEPTTTLFSLGTDNDINASGGTYVAYVFCNTPGFSMSGEYVGTGNSNGPFVYCGFRPAYTLVHCLHSADWWGCGDNIRKTSVNINRKNLTINTNDTEGTLEIDYLSNGFRPRNTNGGMNDTGGVYQFLSFAAAPIVSNAVAAGVPGTAI